MSEVSDGRVWIVVVSKPMQEKRAASELEHAGFQVYLPLRLVERTMGSRIITMSCPFLRGYVFVRVSLMVDQWKRIYRTPGVASVLGGMSPIGVRDKFIDRIRAQEDAGFIRMGLVEDMAPRANLQRGQRVLIDRGTCDVEAIFQEHVDERRALLLVSLLGRDSLHTLDLREIRPQAS